MTKLKGKPPAQATTGRTKAMIFGPAGVGKTWFIMDFPAVYYIDTEGGARQPEYREKLAQGGGSYLGPEEGSLDFDVVVDQMQALATEKHGFKTLAIGSITKLFQVTVANEAERLGDKDVFGASKKPAIAAMRRLINWSMRLDMNIWFEAHETAEWGENPKTGQREERGRIPDIWEKLIYELDLTIQAQRRGDSRVAVVRKTRLAKFEDRSSFPLDYAEFAQRFGEEAITKEVEQLSLASPEQVTEIVKLATLLNVSEADKEKILTKAGADSWSELSTDQAASTITWLKKKIQ